MAQTSEGQAEQPLQVEELIAAKAQHLYELVSDVTNMGRWSPETTSCRWVQGASGPKVGARFRGSNRDGWRRWSTVSTVTAAEPGRRFAFEVDAGPIPIARWCYDFEAQGDHCRVTETWVDRRPGPMRSIMGVLTGVADRRAHNKDGMEQTLARLRQAVEQGSAQG